ncbi:hypothetical protein [Desulforamulus aquiferis]|uniref:Uncharacterized protein n=1 Tax=Desulforamulus aquiferis TaxID=1397668 RepID=A0AAW7ZB80_9FIRM|nr:hypothetical protein [Desulforamulus aquiferis]MDO7786642.1 hypothetical protein [Desulforamulus aquiferis]RYD05867.1 hypothetical protein N752_08205 [Desulforamulus aquiferis]
MTGSVVLLTLFFSGVIYLQISPLLKRKNWKEMIAYLSIMGVGIFYSYGYVLNLEVPNPTDLVEAIFKPMTKLLEGFLGN